MHSALYDVTDQERKWFAKVARLPNKDPQRNTLRAGLDRTCNSPELPARMSSAAGADTLSYMVIATSWFKRLTLVTRSPGNVFFLDGFQSLTVKKTYCGALDVCSPFQHMYARFASSLPWILSSLLSLSCRLICVSKTDPFAQKGSV